MQSASLGVLQVDSKLSQAPIILSIHLFKDLTQIKLLTSRKTTGTQGRREERNILETNVSGSFQHELLS